MSEIRTAEVEPAGKSAGKAGLPARLYSDYTVAFFILAFCAFVYFLTTQITKVPPALAQGIQPSSYPQGVLVFIVAFTIMMLFESRRRPLEAAEPIPGLAYMTTAAMIAALLVATWVDFFVGLILFVAVCVPLWGMRRYLVAGLYGIALSAVVYVMFAEALQVRFPDGILTDLLP
jgi:hypothetical protein